MDIGELATMVARRSSATGTAVALVGLPDTFQRTLMTRSDLDQAIVTGLSFTLTQAFATGIQSLLQSGALLASGGAETATRADVERWSRAAIATDLAAAAGGLGLRWLLRQKPGEKLTRATLRTTSQAVAVTGAAGAAIGVIQEAYDLEVSWRSAMTSSAIAGAVAAEREWDRRRREALLEEQGMRVSEISPSKSYAMGVGISIGATLVGKLESTIAERVTHGASRFLPGGELLWRPVGHAASLGVLLSGVRAASQRVFRMIEGQQFAVEPAIDVPPLQPEVSGGPGSSVDFRTLSKMGRRFVWTLRTPDIIQTVTGEPAVATPIRVYVGLESAATEEERVALAVEELERTGAFDRAWLMITTPTGTGYGNYAAAGTLEFLTRGDCANVVMQYAARPSPISLDRVSDGRSQVRMLVDAIKAKLDQRPGSRRPRVMMFGESLGAWSSQDAFMGQGSQGLIDAGIDHAIWIGTPMESKWKDQVLGPDRSELDATTIGVFNDISEWRALDASARKDIRYVMITHYNDGVAVFGPPLAVQAPEWLADPDARPPTVPRSQRWIPVTSFVQGLIDNKNAARVVPGVFAAEGHDYRADLVPFFDAVLGFGVSEERKTAIVRALETEESRRTRWIKARGKVGESMASVILDKVRDQDPEVFAAAVRAVGQDFVAEDFQDTDGGVGPSDAG